MDPEVYAIKPAHIIEQRSVPVDGYRFPQPRTFVDGELLNDGHIERLGWKGIVEMEEQTKRYMEREIFPLGVKAFDLRQRAKKRTVDLLGKRTGEPSVNTIPFELYLMQNGFEPVMLDCLNAYNPGVTLLMKTGAIVYSHVFVRKSDGRTMQMQFGVAKFNFVFTIGPGDSFTYYQVPVEAEKFDDAMNGLLPALQIHQ